MHGGASQGRGSGLELVLGVLLVVIVVVIIIIIIVRVLSGTKCGVEHVVCRRRVAGGR